MVEKRKPFKLRKGRLTEFVLQTKGANGFDSKGRIKVTTLKQIKRELEALPPTEEQISMLKAVRFALNARTWQNTSVSSVLKTKR
jgi:hypothetical protein